MAEFLLPTHSLSLQVVVVVAGISRPCVVWCYALIAVCSCVDQIVVLLVYLRSGGFGGEAIYDNDDCGD